MTAEGFTGQTTEYQSNARRTPSWWRTCTSTLLRANGSANFACHKCSSMRYKDVKKSWGNWL